jgi:hypothetical protein
MVLEKEKNGPRDIVVIAYHVPALLCNDIAWIAVERCYSDNLYVHWNDTQLLH